jgi:hypothetical protein
MIKFLNYSIFLLGLTGLLLIGLIIIFGYFAITNYEQAIIKIKELIIFAKA